MPVEIAMESHNKDEDTPPESVETVAITFPRGIIGFSRSTNYDLVTDPKIFPFFKLISRDEDNVVFALMDPWLAKNDYQITISDSDQEFLKIADEKDLFVFAITTIYSKKGQLGLNLAAPVVINKAEKLGAQLILEDTRLPLQQIVEFGE